MANVLGYLEEIDDTRLVFLGEDPDQPDVFFLGFRKMVGLSAVDPPARFS